MKIIRQGLLHAGLATIYVALVSLVMSQGSRIFGKDDGPITPIAVLLLFCVSAAVMASLVFGRPVMLYLDGQKREAVKLLGATVGALAGIMIVVFVCLAAANNFGR